jgi:hypothetical protein
MKRGTTAKKWTWNGEAVTVSEFRDRLFRRDGGCLARRFEDALATAEIDRHVCGSAFSESNGGGLTIEHVTRVHGEESRKHDEKHTVTLCGTLNGETMTLANHDMKDFFRDYLRGKYPECPRKG